MFDCAENKKDASSQPGIEDQQLIDLVNRLTDLSEQDVALLIEVRHTLPFISDLEGGDAYIDILTKDNHLAVVVAQHSSPEASFYTHSPVGDIMWRKNEPGVYRTLEIGVPTRELKASVSDRNIIVRQNVSAITNSQNQIIGVLIVEKHLHQSPVEKSFLKQEYPTADTISSGGEIQFIAEYMNDAVLFFDIQGICVYANPLAKQIYLGLNYQDEIEGLTFENLSFGNYTYHDLIEKRQIDHNEIKIGQYNLKVTCTATWNEERQFKGAVLIIKDITEIKNKETELIVKSAAIAEIHHRVKNNLQTIISLIGMQSNRTNNEQVKSFSRDIISRIYSISLTHEILAHNSVDYIDIKEMLSRMFNSSMSFIVPEGLDLNLELFGDEISLQSDTVMAIAMVVNELIQNCIKHAFISRQTGRVTLTIVKGDIYSCITITDDGAGCSGTGNRSGMGLKLVKSLVKDKLKGDIDISSNSPGTKVRFTFICNENYY
ncbi:sensor histidine kinase [Clostridium minihomine]|uniref:sensor histidine kinase n=1 Tax=Clostridium minihomine TaxID=2045012 RepID=UPI000C784EC1|nr:histidine kinase N-terminal domain-containing protein [Clostridium minihomine]